MVNKKSRLGMLVMVLILGMTVLGCDDGSDSGGIPSALVGEWGTKILGGTVSETILTIRSNGQLILSDQIFDISVSGNTVTLKTGATTTGTFDYSISSNVMTVTNGIMAGSFIQGFSPFEKIKSGGLSGTYTGNDGTTITFSGSSFIVSYFGETLASGTYGVSGNILTLRLEGITITWTIVDNNTLKDDSGSEWKK